jgi:hypothetical protein
MQISTRQSLEIVKAPTNNPVTGFQENVAGTWIVMDKGGKVTETITDEQIMDGLINPEK